MTTFAFTTITIMTFFGAFVCSLATSQPQRQHPIPRRPRWVESIRLACIITAGVGFVLTITTIVVVITFSIV